MTIKVGNITLDGNVADWLAAPLVQVTSNTVAGYNVYGQLVSDPTLGNTYVIGISATSTTDQVIGANTYIYLNTDQNSSTGYSPWAGSNVGAEYVVIFQTTSGVLQPYLYAATSAGIGTTPLNGGAPLNWAPSAADGGKSVEIAIPQSLLTPTGGAAPHSINFEALINNSVGLPTYFGSVPEYTITDPTTPPVALKVGNITLDGNIADWPSAPLVQTAANTVAGYNIYGQLVSDPTLGNTYVIGISSTSATDPVIGANTYIYLNTDQNSATGFSPWAGSNVGAEYVVVFQITAGVLQPYLYAATSAGIGTTPLNGGQPLNWAPSAADGGKSVEIAIPQALLTPSGGAAPQSINFDALINGSAGLPAVLGSAPEYTINPSTTQTVNHSIKKVAIIWSQETANNYFKGATDATGALIPQASLTTAYSDLFMTAQHQAEAAGVPYDIITADNLATMTAAQLSQYSALVIPSMTNVQNAAQAAQITTVLSQLQSQYHVGIITAGDFMTADANNALLPTPYLAMQTLLGTTLSSYGTGTYSVSVDPGATSNPIMAGYAPGALIGGASGQFAGTTGGYYTNTGYVSYAGLGATPTTTLADINVTTAPGAATTSSVAGVIQTTNNGAVNTLFSTDGLLGDSNLLQHVIQNAAFGSGPSLTLDTTRFAGLFNSRTDLDQSQFPADIKPASGPGIYDQMIPIMQQWQQQYGFVGSFYTNVGNGAAGADNAGNSLTLTAPYLKQLMQMGSEIGSHSTDHLIAPPTVDANGNPVPTTVVAGQTVSLWNENTNYLYTTAPANGSAPNWTYAYEFGNSNTLIDKALGTTIAGAAVPGANDTSATALNILPYYPSANGLTGYVNGGWTGVGSGSPNAFGYISPTNTSSVYIAPNVTFDFSEVQYDNKTPAQALADWETLFGQLSANSQQPIIVWPWHDYGVTNWNTTTDTANSGPYTTQMFTSFVAYAYNAGYEFVTSEELAARIAAEQRATITETNPTASTINATVTPGVATDDLGTMALNVTNGGTNVIQNAGSWYAYDSKSVFVAKGGVSNVTVTLGATQDDVTHIDALPMRADLQTVTGNGSNLSFSMTGSGVASVHVKTPGTNVVSVHGVTAATLTGDELSLTFANVPLAISPTSPQGTPVLQTVTVSDQATAVNSSSGHDFIFGGTGNDTLVGGPGDTLTGGAGADIFVYTNGANSLVSAFDTITDFGTGADKFRIGHTVTAANFHAASRTASGNLSNDLAAALIATPLAASGADLVSLTGTGSDAGSYVVINNAGATGYKSGSDAVIKLLTGAATVNSTSFIV